jgi:hypothetical protein
LSGGVTPINWRLGPTGVKDRSPEDRNVEAAAGLARGTGGALFAWTGKPRAGHEDLQQKNSKLAARSARRTGWALPHVVQKSERPTGGGKLMERVAT